MEPFKFPWFGLLLMGGLALSTNSTAQQKPENLKIEPYVFESSDGHKIDAELGRLVVSENRHDPRSSSIEIAFVRFKSTAKEAGPPLIYLEGGPGGSGIDAARNQAFVLLMAMRELGDVIALDQRASVLSRPTLECSQSWGRPLDVPGESEETLRVVKEKIDQASEVEVPLLL